MFRKRVVHRADRRVAEIGDLGRSYVLDDLRQFIKATEGWPADTPVEVRPYWLHASTDTPTKENNA